MDNAPALTTACPTREPLAHEAPQDQQPIALHENEAMTQDLYKRHRCYKIEVLSAPIPTPPTAQPTLSFQAHFGIGLDSDGIEDKYNFLRYVEQLEGKSIHPGAIQN